jgi:hypothetical protein
MAYHNRTWGSDLPTYSSRPGHKDAIEGMKLGDQTGAMIGAIHQMRLGEAIEAVQGEPECRLDGFGGDGL